jgi:hypothetical protein
MSYELERSDTAFVPDASREDIGVPLCLRLLIGWVKENEKLMAEERFP